MPIIVSWVAWHCGWYKEKEWRGWERVYFWDEDLESVRSVRPRNLYIDAKVERIMLRYLKITMRIFYNQSWHLTDFLSNAHCICFTCVCYWYTSSPYCVSFFFFCPFVLSLIYLDKLLSSSGLSEQAVYLINKEIVTAYRYYSLLCC